MATMTDAKVKVEVTGIPLLERFGGRKFLIAVYVVTALLVLMIILALRDRLDVGMATVILGAISAVLIQFGVMNTKSNADFLKSIGKTGDPGGGA